jgi:predicted nucleic acid-binding Zn ribbon protein
MYARRRRRGVTLFNLYSVTQLLGRNGSFTRRSLARSNLWKVVVLGEFAQLFVKLTNFILVRFTRHILNHSRLVRLLIRFLVRLLRLGSRIHVPRPIRASTLLSALFSFKRAITSVTFHGDANSCTAPLCRLYRRRRRRRRRTHLLLFLFLALFLFTSLLLLLPDATFYGDTLEGEFPAHDVVVRVVTAHVERPRFGARGGVCGEDASQCRST